MRGLSVTPSRYLRRSAEGCPDREGGRGARFQRRQGAEDLQLDDPRTHRTVAEGAGLDVRRWEEDVKRTDFSTLAREHQEAVRRGVFGVPTLVWPEGRSYYVKITELVPAGRAVALYDAIETVHRFGEVIEIKTPESEGTLAA